jgi:hypothetical protein
VNALIRICYEVKFDDTFEGSATDEKLDVHVDRMGKISDRSWLGGILQYGDR